METAAGIGVLAWAVHLTLARIFQWVWRVVLAGGAVVLLFGIIVQADASFPGQPYQPVCREGLPNEPLAPLRPEAVAVALEMMRDARISAREVDGVVLISRFDIFGRMGEAPRQAFFREAEPIMAQHVLAGGLPGGQRFDPPPALLRFMRRQAAITAGRPPPDDGPPLAWPSGRCGFMRAALTPFELVRP